MKLTPERKALVEAKLKKLMKEVLKEEYAGYKNEDTYNAVLYITNERAIYDIYSKKQGSITPAMAKQYFMLLSRYNKEGYFGVNKKLVDWNEVAEELNNR